MDKNRVSIVIPTYNSWFTLKECISSIQKQTLKPFEIIVVDNASSDSTSQKAKVMFPEIKLITLTTNTGVTGGRNTGIKNSNPISDYLLFFDHDIVADRKMLEELVNISQSDKTIGIVTPKIYYSDDKKRIWAAGTGINLWSGQVLFRGGKDVGQFETAEEVQVAPAVLLVKKSVINKLKSFDDRYFATYEDTDFCFRAKKAGFKIFYAPSAYAFHKIPSDPREESIRLLSRAYFIGRNRILFMKDFGNNFYIFLLFLPIFIIYYLKLALVNGRFSVWINLIQGIFAGLLEVGNIKNILVYIPFSSPWIIRHHLGNGKTLLDIGCGDGSLMKKVNRDKKYEVTGVDLYRPYLKKAKQTGVYKKVIFSDLRTLKFKVKSFDAVLASQVIEHLTKKDGLKLLSTLEKIARKKVVVCTTNGFVPFEPYQEKDDNPLQVHKSGWEIDEMRNYGYKVYGQGSGFIYRPTGLLYKFRNLKNIFIIISYLLSPVSYFVPETSSIINAVKDTKCS